MTSEEHRFVNDIARERDRQRQQWGDEHDELHTVGMWFAILGVRMGRLLEAGLHPTHSAIVRGPALLTPDESASLRYRLIQIAAVASAFAEQLDA